MATNYPAGSDNFTAVAPDDLTSDTIGGRTHSAILNDMGDAVEAVQAELGTDPSGSAATVSARFEAIEANGWVTAPKFAAGAMSAVLLAVARAQPVVSGGDAFDGPDPMWETIFGEPFADAGTPSAGPPAHTFDGGAAA